MKKDLTNTELLSTLDAIRELINKIPDVPASEMDFSDKEHVFSVLKVYDDLIAAINSLPESNREGSQEFKDLLIQAHKGAAEILERV